MTEKIALITAFLGIISLFFLSQYIEPKHLQISEINEDIIGQRVIIDGNITSVKNLDNMEILTVASLQDDSKITVVFFKKESIPKNIARIEGRVREYRGQIEIEADKIRVY